MVLVLFATACTSSPCTVAMSAFHTPCSILQNREQGRDESVSSLRSDYRRRKRFRGGLEALQLEAWSTLEEWQTLWIPLCPSAVIVIESRARRCEGEEAGAFAASLSQ